jgi:WS/DGAT/MGAT family acyltransferase
VAHSALPPAPRNRLNGRTTSSRHLAWSSRPLSELELIERRFGTTINDILLAASAGAVRYLALSHDEAARRLKAMVPVSVRAPEERWGNRIAFFFPGLPCDEPDAVRRLRDVHAAMCARKRGHEAEAADILLRTLGRAPRPLRNLASRLLTSACLSNVTISNVPGPSVPLYLMGCQAEEAYPVVPLTAGHGVSIGMTSVDGTACFGVYADGSRAADADRLARAIGEGIDELLRRCAEAGPATERTPPIAMPRPRRSPRRDADLAV